MKISYNIDESTIPEGRGRPRKSEIAKVITAFVTSGNRNVCVECESIKEAMTHVANATTWQRRNGKSVVVVRRKNMIYILKAENNLPLEGSK